MATTTKAEVQLPTNPQHEALYASAIETGVVPPPVLEAEAISEAEAHDPAIRPSSDDYEDRHVRLCGTKRTLTIKHWIMFHPTLVVPVDSITWIHPASLVVKGLGVTCWGLAAHRMG
ncbi:hypothetical protein DACRYDRAFT_19815 [Dacryopinax primogenitus]|uniref:Uncharacterized protein n=1 Tax=Dacryopinax primogenitus (strain DJM 731) TaxID=1858805 RepID=M5G4R1_DACPD|nr:uncharacterized protein DACRYDRAFT_19815 [Dacryopinax primogenitus]EJU05241.1 hypothetical protein DACRYDRAFT_19815 [Dacryopinax primogenitus]